MLKTYVYRVYPNKEQEILLAKHFGCTRFIYNWGLAKKIAYYEQNKKTLSYFDLAKQLTELKQQEEYMSKFINKPVEVLIEELIFLVDILAYLFI